MDKNEAMKRLDAIEAEAKELRRIIEGPEVDPREWVGKWGFATDSDSACPDNGSMWKLVEYRSDEQTFPYVTNGGNAWRYFRPATAEELGFAPEIKPDWSKAPEWAKSGAFDEAGRWVWMRNSTPSADADAEWNGWGGGAHVEPEEVWTTIFNWRDTLTKRPE